MDGVLVSFVFRGATAMVAEVIDVIVRLNCEGRFSTQTTHSCYGRGILSMSPGSSRRVNGVSSLWNPPPLPPR